MNERMRELWERHRSFLTHPAFLAVLGLKIVSSFLFASEYFLEDRFLAFVNYFIDSGFSDPWTEFMNRGIRDAFPYSPMMLGLLTAPIATVAPFFGSAAAIPGPLAIALARIPVLAGDVLIYLALCRWFERKWKLVLFLHWASPILFYISYVHGQLDAVPTAFLFLSLAAASSRRPALAGAALGAGLATKFHLAVAVPLLAMYLLRSENKARRLKSVVLFALTLGAVAALFIVPASMSEGYRSLVLIAKEIKWIYALRIDVPMAAGLLVCPAALLVLVLHFFAYKNTTQDILILYLGLIFAVLLLLVPPMPGWAYWFLPFLFYFLIRQDVETYAPYWLYTAFYFVYFVGFLPKTASVPLQDYFPAEDFAHKADIVFTGMQTSLAVLTIWIYRIGVRAYARYRDPHRVLAVGIGGDSGAGKNTLAEAIGGVIGDDRLVSLHGDDYHRWERNSPSWEELTHLDPRSNYFQEPIQHLSSLKGGLSIYRKRYDHSVGKFSEAEKVVPNRFVLYEGLHPFAFQRMRDLFDVKIFLATSEPLRRYWKLQRDCGERGHERDKVLKEIERRRPDADKFIRPQLKFADWSIEYVEVDPIPEETPEDFSLALRVCHRVSSEISAIERLTELLREAGGQKCEVRWSLEPNLERQVLEVCGDWSAEVISRISDELFPDAASNRTASPQFHSGTRGVDQLVFLTLLENAASRNRQGA